MKEKNQRDPVEILLQNIEDIRLGLVNEKEARLIIDSVQAIVNVSKVKAEILKMAGALDKKAALEIGTPREVVIGKTQSS